ncbi:MAG: Hsp20/alpha crystallin family protein [Desulfarculales bacterium]|nr:Hsp20/alpha crystallin family protein [Desulfarculales bacterium]
MFFNRRMYPRMHNLFLETPHWQEVGRLLEAMTQEQPMFPALKLVEQKDRFVLEARLPGVENEDLHVSVQGKTVYLEGERKAPETSNSRYHRQERGFGSFRRALTLPMDIDANAVRASREDGILRLDLPKNQEMMPRAIKIN